MAEKLQPSYRIMKIIRSHSVSDGMRIKGNTLSRVSDYTKERG